jgi:UDP-N-acetylglucosamine 2-epimerase (non-hydrolysing)
MLGITDKLKIMTILGTRPEATKLAPVILELRRFPEQFSVQVVSTGQHREMLPQSLAIFGLVADTDLDIMQPKQSLEHITQAALAGLAPLLADCRPDLVLVEGDTTTVFAASLAAFYQRIPVAHLEAGLRTDNRYSPFPEEINRRLAAVLAALHLAPTQPAQANLLREGYAADTIYVTGNTSIDAILWAADQTSPPLPAEAEGSQDYILVTAHRRENWGEPLTRICEALRQISSRFGETEILFSVHPNPRVREVAEKLLAAAPHIHLLSPPDYLTFVHMMKRARLIITDSGGIQEEAPALHKPVLVLRESTERPEGLVAGTARLVGADPEKIVSEATRLLTDREAYAAMARAVNPFGDGRASARVRQAILHHFGVIADRPVDFTGAVD